MKFSQRLAERWKTERPFLLLDDDDDDEDDDDDDDIDHNNKNDHNDNHVDQKQWKTM